MVVVSEHWVKNVATYCPSAVGSDLNGGDEMVIGGGIAAEQKTTMAKAVLVCRPNSHPFQERTLALDQPVKVGRSVARARATSTNAIFDCKVLSRHHALLSYENGKFYLQDTKSSNGTFVNNNRLTAETEHHEVSSGDIVQFGVDVIENNRKVTHGCIIATLKLYLPDGKEAKASPSIAESPTHFVPLDELYKLHQIIQEATQREQCLEAKLMALQAAVNEAKKSADESWQAYVGEERLLSRVSTLESQLARAAKNWDEDKYREEILKLQEDNAMYQSEAKRALEKLHEERLQAIALATDQERRRILTEQQLILTKDQVLQEQIELQVLALKLTEEEKKTSLERAKMELQQWQLQEKLKAETEKVEALQSKVASSNEPLQDENQALDSLDKQNIYDLKTKEEMLESEPDNWKNWSNGVDEESHEQNHINLTVAPVCEGEGDGEKTDVSSESKDGFSRQDTVVEDESTDDTLGGEKRVSFNLPEDGEKSPSSSEENEKDDFDTDAVDSKTLKYKYQSAQNELKKRIEVFETILEANRIKLEELERTLGEERQANSALTEQNETLRTELVVFQQRWKESCNEGQQLKDRVEALLRQTATSPAATPTTTIPEDQSSLPTISSASPKQQTTDHVSYEQLVVLEEELVVLKERYSQINDEKLKLQHELKSLKLQYNKLCNSSFDKMYFYVAPLVLIIMYLVISAMVS